MKSSSDSAQLTAGSV